MNDLPASLAGLGPYLLPAGAAIAALVGGREGGDRRRSPALSAAAAAPAAAPAPGGQPGQSPLLPIWIFARTRGRTGARTVLTHPLVSVVGALAGFGLTARVTVGGMPLVAFLALCMIPTAMLGFGVFRGRAGLRQFVTLAASDLALAVALMHRHSATGLWSTPLPGDLGAGAALVALATLLRLAAPAAGRTPEGMPEGGTVRVGWWQGLFLAWWAGPSAGTGLAFAALVLWGLGMAGARRRREESALLFAAGLAVLLAANGAGAATVAVVGLAGSAFAMGERAVSLATLALTPLSAPLSSPALDGVLGRLGSWLPAALAVFTVAWAAMLHHLVALGPLPEAGRRGGRRGGRLPAAFAVAGTAALLLSGGASGPAEQLVWAAYGVGLAALVAAAILRTSPGPVVAGWRAVEGGRQDDGRIETVHEAGLAVLGAVFLAVAVLVEAGLTLAGLRTGFL